MLMCLGGVVVVIVAVAIFMLSKDEATAKAVEKEMSSIYERIGLDNQTHLTTINQEGVKLVSS